MCHLQGQLRGSNVEESLDKVPETPRTEILLGRKPQPPVFTTRQSVYRVCKASPALSSSLTAVRDAA